MLLIKLIDARRGLHNKCVELFSDQKIAEEIYRKLCDGIEDCETVEAEPKHGLWIEDEKGAKVTAYKCSECGRVVWDDTGYDVSEDYPYCHCGAKMDK